MSIKQGQLLWNRIQFTVPAATNGGGPGILDLDTGLTQVNRAWGNSSDGEPGFGTPSRIQVVPLAPIAGVDGLTGWVKLSHGEPFLDPITNTIHVEFTNDALVPAFVNGLFWNPHTAMGPGEADPYTAPT